VKPEEETLEGLLGIHESVTVAQQKLEEATGVNFPYDTLIHWRKGRFDLATIERAFALKEFFRLSDKRFIEILRSSKKQARQIR
jgi:hypothetical protein